MIVQNAYLYKYRCIWYHTLVEVIPISKTSSAVKNRYNAKAYDRINFVVPKGEKEKIKAAAEAAGESVNQYILKAVKYRMEQNKINQQIRTD